MNRSQSKATSPGKRGAADNAERAVIDHLVARLKAGADLRKAKVRRVRTALRQQTYFNTLKLDVAADRMMSELEAHE